MSSLSCKLHNINNLYYAVLQCPSILYISDEHQEIENDAFLNKARNACFNEFQVKRKYWYTIVHFYNSKFDDRN